MSVMPVNGKKFVQILLHEDSYRRLRKLKFALEKDSFDEVVKALLDKYEREGGR